MKSDDYHRVSTALAGSKWCRAGVMALFGRTTKASTLPHPTTSPHIYIYMVDMSVAIVFVFSSRPVLKPSLVPAAMRSRRCRLLIQQIAGRPGGSNG